MIPKIIEFLKNREKPFSISSEMLKQEVVAPNLYFLAKHPLDVVGPGRFETGLKNLADFLEVDFEKRADGTYYVTSLIPFGYPCIGPPKGPISLADVIALDRAATPDYGMVFQRGEDPSHLIGRWATEQDRGIVLTFAAQEFSEALAFAAKKVRALQAIMEGLSKEPFFLMARRKKKKVIERLGPRKKKRAAGMVARR